MKTAVLTLGLLASLAVAQPHHGHNHHRRKVHNHGHHQKRGVVTEWVTETVVEYVTEIVDEHTTETILPKSKFRPPQAAAATTTTGRPGQFFEGASQAPKPAAETAAPAPYVPGSSVLAMIVTDENSPAPAPPPPPPAPPAPAPAPSVPAPKPNVQVANPAPAPAEMAAPAGARHGDLTFFTVGLGACGFDDTGKDYAENIVALSHLLMGTQSNGNPYCGRRITVSYGGKTAQAVVRDKCMGCAADNIDGSEKLFTEFQPLGTGRFGVQWWFSD